MIGSPAIALDEILAGLTGEDIAAMRAATPVDALDQMDAATRAAQDTSLAEMRITHGMTGDPDCRRYADVPDWLRLSITDTLTRYLTGRHTTCEHDPSPLRPEPVMAAAWRPGLVTCRACIHLWRIAGDADRTCDQCGHVCAGLPDDGIHLCRVHFGPLVFSYGLCGRCVTGQEVTR